MSPQKRNAGRAPGASVDTEQQQSPKPTAAAPASQAPSRPDRPFVVIVDGTRVREWARYSSLEKADQQVRALRRIGMDAHCEVDPTHAAARRRFLLTAVSLGLLRPEHVARQIIDELDATGGATSSGTKPVR